MENQETVSNVRVVIEKVNALRRVYNVASQLSEVSIASFNLPVQPTDYYMREVGEIARQIVTEIQDTIPGVEGIILHRYSLEPTINVAFESEWDSIESAILGVIEAHFGDIVVQASTGGFFGVIVGFCPIREAPDAVDDEPDDLS